MQGFHWQDIWNAMLPTELHVWHFGGDAVLRGPLLPQKFPGGLKGNPCTLRRQVIWSVKMREELLMLLEAQRSEPDAAAAAGFRYKALGGELVVAAVFVRIFIEQPGYAVQDPAAFCKVGAADLAQGGKMGVTLDIRKSS